MNDNPLVNQEMEATLIGAVLAMPKTLGEASFLCPDDFAFQIHRDIWAEIERRQAAGEAIVPHLIAQSLRDQLASFGGLKFLNQLTCLCLSLPTVGPWAYEIKNLSVKREIMGILEVRREGVPETVGSGEEVIAEIMADLERITSKASPRLKSERETRVAEVQAMKKPVRCYPTGFFCLDDAMAGGLHAGRAYGIFARMKSGKTLLASQISHRLNLAGVKHVYAACEMGSAEIEHRAMAEELGVNALAFLDDRYRQNPGFVSRVGELALKAPGNILYLDCPGLTFDQLRRDITHAVLAKEAQGFILDYLQLVGGQRKGQTKAEHLDDICQWIAEICRKRSVFALVLGQMNQEGNTRGGEGVRLAFDQVYELRRQQDPAAGAWLEMMVTRYTKWRDIGSETTPALYLDQSVGPRFTEGQAA